MAKVEIHIAPTAQGTTISVDGQEFGPKLRSFSIHAEVGKASRVVLEFIAADVTITGEVGEVERHSAAGRTCTACKGWMAEVPQPTADKRRLFVCLKCWRRLEG